MDLKIQCHCGQKIAFEAEPVNGRIPMEIECPVCNANITDLADAQVAERMAAEDATSGSPPVPADEPLAVSGETSPTPDTPPAEPAPAAYGGLKLRMTPAHEKKPEPAAAPPPSPRPFAGAAKPASAARKPVPKVFAEPHFGKAMLGAAIGATIAVGIWFALYKATEGWKFGVMAIAVGWFAGFGARWIGRSEGPNMGLATAAVALVFIIGFQAYRANDEMWKFAKDIDVDAMYEQEVAQAKKTLEAVPNGTDEEIRALFIKEAAQFGQQLNARDISAEEIAEYRDDAWKDAKALTDGTYTKEQFKAEMDENLAELKRTPGARIVFWIKAIGIFNIIAIIIGVGSAYKFGNGAG